MKKFTLFLTTLCMGLFMSISANAQHAGTYDLSNVLATRSNIDGVVSKVQSTEPEYMDMELNITNTIFDAETMAFIGSDDEYGIEVSLAPDTEKAIEGEEMTFGLAATSTMTFSGQDLEIIDGQIAIVDLEAPAANAIVAAKFGEEYYRFNITMTKAAAAVVEVAIVDATVAIDETGVLSYASNWTYEEVTYPVSVRLAGYEEGKTEYAAPQVAELQIGGDGDDDPWLDWAVADEADVAVEGETITLEAYFTSFATGTTYHVIISGIYVQAEPEFISMELNITNTVFDAETMAFIGSDGEYGIEVSLVPDMENPIEGEEMTFGLAPTSSIVWQGQEFVILDESKIAVIDPYAPLANALVYAKLGDNEFYAFSITMSKTAQIIEVVIPEAIAELDDDVLTFTSELIIEDITYPVFVRLAGYVEGKTEYEGAQIAELQIGGDGDADPWLDWAIADKASVEVVGTSVEFEATFTSFATGASYHVIILGILQQEPAYIDMELIVSNLVVDYETFVFFGTDNEYGIEISLIPDAGQPVEDMEMTYGLAEGSSIIFGTEEMEIVTGIITIDMETPAAEAFVMANFGDEVYRFHILMTKAAAAIVEVVIEDATVVIDETGVLSYASTWTKDEVTYPVSVRLAGYEAGKTDYTGAQVAELQIGGDDDADPWLDWAVATEANIAVEGETITLEATFTSYATNATYHVIISGAIATTGLDNISTSTTPVKVIKNNQLIIIRDGVKYNVQGAVIK